MSDPTRLSVLVMLCLSAAGGLWVAALAPAAGAGEGAPPVALPAPPAAAFAMAPLDAFAETVARPLFVRGRRPAGIPAIAAAPGAPLAPPPSAPRLSVTGIAITGALRTALVQVESAAKPLSVAVGGEISGWTVTAISPDRIRLEKGAEAFEAALRGFKKNG